MKEKEQQNIKEAIRQLEIIKKIYQKKWKKEKNKSIWKVFPSLMNHAHLRNEPVIYICEKILKILKIEITDNTPINHRQ